MIVSPYNDFATFIIHMHQFVFGKYERTVDRNTQRPVIPVWTASEPRRLRQANNSVNGLVIISGLQFL